MYIRLSPYNIDVAASTVAFTVQMLLKKPADCYRYGSRQVGVPNQFSSRSHLVKKNIDFDLRLRKDTSYVLKGNRE